MAKRNTKPRDLYQEVTDTILGYLDRGTPPWRQPIKSAGGDATPKSLSTKRPYRGINTFLLAMIAWAHGYESSYWLTFKQAKALGGKVRKGEKGSLVVFWKQHVTEDRETSEEKKIAVLRHYTVFNVDQVEGVTPPDEAPAGQPQLFEPIDAASRIVAGYRDGPSILHGGRLAYYKPLVDVVSVPEPSRFDPPESYYATLFHELAHSTGHSSRLGRGLDTDLAPFGSPDYSKEELVAEMGSAFLSAAAGISPATIEQSAAYIDGWRRKLTSDKRLVIQAAGLGQRAADRVLGVTFEADSSADQPVEGAADRRLPGLRP